MGWPGGDLAVARTAAAYGIPFTLSTAATVTIEEVAEKAPGRLWFQLYVLHDRAFTDRLVERARAAGYEALVVTVDLPGAESASATRTTASYCRSGPAGASCLPAWRIRRGPCASPPPAASPSSSTARIGGPATRRHGLHCVLGRPAARCLVRPQRARPAARPVEGQADREGRLARRRRRARSAARRGRGLAVEPRRQAARRGGRRGGCAACGRGRARRQAADR